MLVLLIAMADASTAKPGLTRIDPDTVIITGERVNRALKDTPSSVHVTTARELTASGADRIDQVLAGIPNLQLGEGSEGPTIRGQNSTGVLSAFSSRVLGQPELSRQLWLDSGANSWIYLICCLQDWSRHSSAQTVRFRHRTVSRLTEPDRSSRMRRNRSRLPQDANIPEAKVRHPTVRG